MNDGSPVERALSFATRAHLGQTRKGSGLPYVVHTVDVAKRLGDAGIKDDDVIMAGLLHDVVEDTEIELETVAREFGARAAGFVQEMTFDESQQSKAEYIASFAHGSIEGVPSMSRFTAATDPMF
ncbi:MAG: HD domain-containing protein [Planctomycetota bacterium]